MRRLACLLLVTGLACSHSSPAPTASPSTSPAPTSTTPSASSSPSALPTSFGGENVVWPQGARTAPPPALGAVETLAGGPLAAGLLLPRIGGTAAAPLVMTPCGREVTLARAEVRVVPASGSDLLVVVDPGHGGPQLGAVAPDGDREKDRNLQIAREVRSALAGRVARVYLTRDRDMEATLDFRARLVDALRADAAVSVHLNSAPDGPRPTPGTETYGSIADPGGRRIAGVVYASIRRYVQTLPGPWVGDRDAGAKYRVGSDGRDYYGLLRKVHRPFAIAESMFISSAHEAALAARPEVRAGLGRAIADGLVAYLSTAAPGSGWVRPYPRKPDPSTHDNHVCVDPTS